MKNLLIIISIAFSCVFGYSQPMLFQLGQPVQNHERFKAPDYNPAEDPLLMMNHFMTECWDPEVANVKPGVKFSDSPSDAIRLFDGTDPNKEWHENARGADGTATIKNVTYTIKDGALYPSQGSGSLITNRDFEDFQLHIEWMILPDVTGEGQARGNGGVYLQGIYEIQILDSWGTRTYKNGQAGALYKQYAPLANSSLPPVEWQTFEIVYTAPRFGKDTSSDFTPPRVTVFHNGVLI